MRDNVKELVRFVSETLQVPEPIVEIGSLQVEGQVGYADMRPFFSGKTYCGCDMRPGIGVDRIEDVEHLTFEDGSVGTVLMLDTLEHVGNCHRAMQETYRVLKPGGFIVLISVMDFPVHLHPCDYWRFTPQGFELLLDAYSPRWVFFQGNALFPHTVIGFAVKNGERGGIPEGMDDLTERMRGQATALAEVQYDDPSLEERYAFNQLEQGYLLFGEARREIAALGEQLTETQQTLAQCEIDLKEQAARLNQIYRSLGWRITQRYRRVREVLFPAATLRGNIYGFILGWFK
jgi:SAM-dependent methyltransferase